MAGLRLFSLMGTADLTQVVLNIPDRLLKRMDLF